MKALKVLFGGAAASVVLTAIIVIACSGWYSLHYLLGTYGLVFHKAVTHHEFVEAILGTLGSELFVPIAFVTAVLRTFGII